MVSRKRREIIESFQVVGVAQLGKHLDRDVRITTTDGHVREGFLSQINEEEAIVAWYIHGGQVSVNVPLEHISKAEVLLRKTM